MINRGTEVHTDGSAYVSSPRARARADHPPVEGSADFSTVQPELDVVLFLDHHILAMFEPGISRREEEEAYAADHCE